MASIYNQDGSVGFSKQANKWDAGANPDSRYSLYSTFYNYEFSDRGDGTYTYKRSRKYEPALLSDRDVNNLDNSPLQSSTVANFVNKMQKFYFAPPSDNLWTVSIRLHSDGLPYEPNSILTLYDNIIRANSVYDSLNIKSRWGMDYDPKIVNNPRNFIYDLSSHSRIFLAQTVNFRPYALTINENAYSSGQASGGFLTFGKILQSKSGGNECNISFLVSNWDICDVLIDPWIAAIAKYGLIEDSTIDNIKADIIIEEYSASVDKKLVKSMEGYNFGSMMLRKTYTFYKAFPINRGEISKNYEFNQAGAFKTSTVSFKFDEYKIKYHI